MTNTDHEDKIVRQVITDLLAAGYELNLENGGEGRELPEFTTDFDTIYREMKATDEDYLLARIPKSPKVAFVRFVYGNDGHDVINDYNVSLADALKPSLYLSDRLMGEYLKEA